MMEVLGLARSLTDHLRLQIICGELAPGRRINEAQIASEQGISRSPLREALRVLENEHLIASFPRKGSFVTDVSIENLNEIYQMREMIECYAVDLLERKNVREFPLLASSSQEERALVAPSEKDPAQVKIAYIESLAGFHLKLVESSGNKRLFEFYRAIFSDINRYMFLNAFLRGVGKHQVKDHHQILELLKKGKYEMARQVVRAHIRYSCDDLKAKKKNVRGLNAHPRERSVVQRSL